MRTGAADAAEQSGCSSRECAACDDVNPYSGGAGGSISRAEAAKHRRQRIEQWPKVERSEGTPQSARRRTGRSTKCDVGSPGAAGALRGRAPSEGGAGGSISRAEAARHRRQRIEQWPKVERSEGGTEW